MDYLNRVKEIMKELGLESQPSGVKSVKSAERLPDTNLLTSHYHLKYPEGQITQQELAEIQALVHDKGICLLYSHMLKDYVAFIKDDSYLKDVPLGFVPYKDDELKTLFGGPDSPSSATLKLVHEAKKRGGVVTDSEEVR